MEMKAFLAHRSIEVGEPVAEFAGVAIPTGPR